MHHSHDLRQRSADLLDRARLLRRRSEQLILRREQLRARAEAAVQCRWIRGADSPRDESVPRP